MEIEDDFFGGVNFDPSSESDNEERDAARAKRRAEIAAQQDDHRQRSTARHAAKKEAKRLRQSQLGYVRKKKIVIELEGDEKEIVMEAFTLQLISEVHERMTNSLMENPDELNLFFQRATKRVGKAHGVMPNKSEINKVYQRLLKEKKVAPSFAIDTLTKNKSVRSRSGILPIAIATDGENFSCAFDCHFCPNEIVAKGAPRDMARSYLSSEGSFLRGIIEDFLPANQVWRRLLELEMMGHPPDKLEMIVLGGTWDSYDASYREFFCHSMFYACNMFQRFSLRLDGDLTHLTKEWAKLNPFQNHMQFDPEKKIQSFLREPKSLAEEKAENENAKCARIIGIVLETRPDQISKASLARKRRLGCTRIQLGVQHTDDEILSLNNRGHYADRSVTAIWAARDAGFKVDGHLMPDLPGTTREKDEEMLRRVFCGDDLQLDYCKLYPCLDLPYTVTREWKESGKWKPMAEHAFEDFLDILRLGMFIVPPWVRVNRVHRDFPEANAKNDFNGFVSDNIRSNLQQMVMDELAKNDQACYDIRSREIKSAFPHDYTDRARIFVRTYRANSGTEIFISVEIPKRAPKCADDALLMGLLRLRITDVDVARMQGDTKAKGPVHLLPEFKKNIYARVRELHVYGNLKMSHQNQEGNSVDTNSQHTGVGKFLMAAAERFCAAYGVDLLSVISGVGVRGYYKSLGYHLDSGEGEFMVKNIADPSSRLPLVLFGREVSDVELVLPVTLQKIPTAHLPPPAWARLVGAPSNLCTTEAPPWATSHTYAHIQDGQAQLVIIGPMDKAPTSSSAPPLWIVLAAVVALLALLLRVLSVV